MKDSRFFQFSRDNCETESYVHCNEGERGHRERNKEAQVLWCTPKNLASKNLDETVRFQSEKRDK